VIRKLPVRIAAATAGLVLAGGVAAAAGSPPDAADDGLSTAEEHSGVVVPVADSTSVESEDAVETEFDEAELEADEKADDEATEQLGGPVDNHGAEVSAVAHTTFATGREHGEAVSEVARGDHGPDAATSDTEASDTEAEETEVGDAEQQTQP